MEGARATLRCGVLLAGGLLVAACSTGGDTPEAGKAARSSAGADAARPSADAPAPSPTRLDFTPDPGRAPASRAQALRLARAVAGTPDQWGPGYRARDPFESSSASWPVLDRGCVWQQRPVPDDVLATLTRFSELPARGGKGPIRVAAVVTVHRDAGAADWEMASTLEEALRCPDQQLRAGERISGLLSTGNSYGALNNVDADDRLAETGQYYSDELGGPHYYFWTQARLGQVTVAAVGKGSEGRTQKEVDDGMAQAIGTMLGRAGDELEARR